MKIRSALIVALLISHSLCLLSQENCNGSNNKKSQKLYKEAVNLLNQEKFSPALHLLKEAISKDDEFVDAYYLIAHIYKRQNDLDNARDHFLEVWDLCRSYNDEIYLHLAEIEFKLENYGSAYSFSKELMEQPHLTDPALMEEAVEMSSKAGFFRDIYSNPVHFDPKPVENICTQFDEYLPMLTPDNDYLYFTRRHKKDSKFTVIGDVWVEDFCVAEKKDGYFTQGKPLKPPFNQSNNEGGASLSSDNKDLYLTICNHAGGAGSCDIFYSSNEKGEWGNLILLSSNVNDSMWQSQVSMAPDGQTLYFSSDMKGGFGGKDIYYTKKLNNGLWSDPVNLGPVVNTELDEKSPFIHQDGVTLYFSSNGHLGLGGFDIFISRKDSSGNWSDSRNIGFPINSDFDDLGFFVSTNGKTGYFASNKLDGYGGWDIYEFDLYEEARPKKVLFVKGSVKDEKGNVLSGVQVQLRDLKTKRVENIAVDSVTGEYVYSEIFENNKMLMVNKKGYFYDEKTITESDIDSINSISFNAKLDKLEVGNAFPLENILFDTDKSNLKENSRQSLENLVRFLDINRQFVIEIAGHTDDVGDDEENKILSENRAKIVYEYLVENGIDTSRMKFSGYGETQPVVKNVDEKSRALNRRTEIRIIGNM